MGLPTTLQFIEAEEARLGVIIPSAIKPFILENNGGSVCLASRDHWHLFAVKDDRSRKHITRSANHIERETKSAMKWFGFPLNAIALGANGSGDLLISISGDPEIYVWNHETARISKTLIKPIT